MPVPNLRNADPLRNGITIETVVYEDLLGSLFIETLNSDTGNVEQRLASEEALIGLSRSLDRFELDPDPKWLSDGISDVDNLLESVKKQQVIAQMLKKRLAEVRAKLNRQLQFEASERAKHLPDWKVQKRHADR